MGKQNSRIMMQYAALAMLLTVAIMVKEATSMAICNIDTSDLEKCRAAASGDNPPPPGPDCCDVAKTADLNCLCSFKGYLVLYGINPSKIKPILANCHVNSPSCL